MRSCSSSNERTGNVLMYCDVTLSVNQPLITPRPYVISKKRVTTDVAVSKATTMVEARLDYCNAILYGTSTSNTQKWYMYDSRFLSASFNLAPFDWVCGCLCCTSLWHHLTTTALVFLFLMFHSSFQIQLSNSAMLSFSLHICPYMLPVNNCLHDVLLKL